VRDFWIVRRVIGVLRHALAVVLLPVMVTLVVPFWIARRFSVSVDFPDSFLGSLGVASGLAFLTLGVSLFVDCVRRFAREGGGTLAPWDPPRELVTSGPYRWVRHPMISGVTAVLIGEALFLRSLPHLTWAVVFAALNMIYIPLVEEPQLERRFGDAWRRYRDNVPPLVPRTTPWAG
jgi:protein-S-isoprenylcysteine O-methyltransferase Ste14